MSEPFSRPFSLALRMWKQSTCSPSLCNFKNYVKIQTNVPSAPSDKSSSKLPPFLTSTPERNIRRFILLFCSSWPPCKISVLVNQTDQAKYMIQSCFRPECPQKLFWLYNFKKYKLYHKETKICRQVKFLEANLQAI